MEEYDRASGADRLPVAPSLAPTLAAANVPRPSVLVDRRVVLVSALAIVIAVGATLVARLLTALIGLITNLAYYGRVSTAFVSPADHHLGVASVAVPVVGGLIVGVMARWGSQAIRGHGIPEAMEQVLLNQSRIPPRLTFLKPLSAAVAIGTGGPFGAEGPIIATGGALGSLVGQLLAVTAAERKTLLAAGAAAGMAATFGSPVAAVLLAIELLLFELRARSIVPVALASATAAGLRVALVGAEPMFPLTDVAAPAVAALAAYIAIGALVGVAAVYVTRLVYVIEDAFAELPIHWMWWPALGGVVVGLVGLVAPRTLGVGYDNISGIVAGDLAGRTLLLLCAFKLVSWSIALGSGTSGGTLAPLFTIGGGLGAALGAAGIALLPHAGLDPRIAALVGMAAIFAGASRALLTSIVFAFETTLQPLGLLPLLGGCTAAYLVSCLMMRTTIMTEKIVRRGVRVPEEYVADFLDQVLVRDAASAGVVALRARDTLARVRTWLGSGAPGTQHQGFPVLDEQDRLIGVLTRRDLVGLAADEDTSRQVHQLVARPPIIVYDDCSLREAADHMTHHDVGRLPVVTRAVPHRLVGMLTRSDLLRAHRPRLAEQRQAGRVLNVGRGRRKRSASA
ncbi:MAG TPA: chloride channel protein [Candidatus Binatia bacterium]